MRRCLVVGRVEDHESALHLLRREHLQRGSLELERRERDDSILHLLRREQLRLMQQIQPPPELVLSVFRRLLCTIVVAL